MLPIMAEPIILAIETSQREGAVALRDAAGGNTSSRCWRAGGMMMISSPPRIE